MIFKCLFGIGKVELNSYRNERLWSNSHSLSYLVASQFKAQLGQCVNIQGKERSVILTINIMAIQVGNSNMDIVAKIKVA